MLGRNLDTALGKYGKPSVIDKVYPISEGEYIYTIRLSDDPDDVMQVCTVGKLTQDELIQLRKYFRWLYRDG